ncbi:MAG: DHHA1 domain-containing protein [Acidilobaceae archaeon]
MIPEAGSKRVLVIADWDADGTVSAAMIVYAQEKLGVFPARQKTTVSLAPSGPRDLREKLQGCWDYIVVLDIPCTPEVEASLAELKRGGCNSTIIYFDHHDSTLESKSRLEGELEAIVFYDKGPTAMIVRSVLEKQGIKLPQRLRLLSEAVAAIEGKARNPRDVGEKLIKIALGISKYMNKEKDSSAWCTLVKKLADVIPFDALDAELGTEIQSLVARTLEVSREADEEMKAVAMEFAMSAKRVGYVRLVDARKKWEGRGASALASAIHKTVGEPVVLLVEKDDGTTLVIARSSRGEARKIVEMLADAGIVEDKGGHDNIATGRLSANISLEDFEEALRRISLRLRS